MMTETTIVIDAPATTVWDVYTEVESWPTWTRSVRRVEVLDEPALQVGHRVRIDQPRFPPLVWEVTEVVPGSGWTWVQRSPGGTTVATHEVVAEAPDRTSVRQTIDQGGPIGALVGRLTRRLTRRYLDMEAAGLKHASEARHRRDVASS
jgi:uncharacterized membrane protein